MKRTFYITGAAGFVGSTIARYLHQQGEQVRALLLPGDPLAARLPEGIARVEGDILRPEDLDRFLELGQERRRVVIHCAAIISMSMRFVQKVYDVNVPGTANVIAACEKAGIEKLVYISSVHALEELPHGQTMREQENFDPERVVGAYAKTKAQAAQLMMDAYREKGLPVCLLFPSGITGPGDAAGGNFTQTLLDYAHGRLPVGVEGGYSFTDVRDVTLMAIAAVDKGVPGEGYVVASHYISVKRLFELLHELTGAKKVTTMLPRWLVLPLTPLIRLYYRLRGQKEVVSSYALHTLGSNASFDSSKAREVQGFNPRPIEETMKDTYTWLVRAGML